MTTPQEPAMGVSDEAVNAAKDGYRRADGEWTLANGARLPGRHTHRIRGALLAALPHMQPAGEAVAWMTPQSIAHLEKQNGVAKVDAWNTPSGGDRVPVFTTQPAPVDVRVPNADQMRLHMGELTTDEVQIAQAAYRLGASHALLSAQPSADAGDGEDDPGEFGVGIMPNPKARYWQERAAFWRSEAIARGYDPEQAVEVDAAIAAIAAQREAGEGWTPC